MQLTLGHGWEGSHSMAPGLAQTAAGLLPGNHSGCAGPTQPKQTSQIPAEDKSTKKQITKSHLDAILQEYIPSRLRLILPGDLHFAPRRQTYERHRKEEYFVEKA